MQRSRWKQELRRLISVCGLVIAPGIGVQGARAGENVGEVVLSLEAGEVRDFVLRLGDGDLPPLRAEIGRLAELPAGLRVGFTTSTSPTPRHWPGEALSTATDVPAGGDVQLRALARRCSEPGKYRLPLRLSPTDPISGRPAELEVWLDVDPGPSCGGIYAETAIAAGSPVLLAVVLFCGWRMWRRSEFLQPAAVARKIAPLSWQETGTTQVDSRGLVVTRSQVLRGLAWRRRLAVWMRSWQRRLRRRPWLALQGGVPYRETARLELGNRYDAIALVPVSEHEKGLLDRGSLYAVASKDEGLHFVAVPGRDGTVGGMEIEPPLSTGRSEIRLTGQARLLFRGSFEEDPNGPAGWRIG